MSHYIRYLALAFLVLLLGPAFLGQSRIGIGTQASSQVDNGNWIVSGNEVVQGQTIVLNGNLIVQSGGNLTMISDTLIVNSSSPDQYGIQVDPGGILRLESSNLTFSEAEQPFSFTFSGNSLQIDHSYIRGIGSGQPYSTQPTSGNQGLYVNGGTALIENSIFSDDFNDVIIGTNATVMNNNMSFDPDRWSGVTITQSSGSKIINNTISAGYNGVYMTSSSSNLIANNSMSGIVEGAIYAFGVSNNRMIGNNITKIGFSGIALDQGSSGNTIANNTFDTTSQDSGAAGIHIYGGSQNNVENNIFANCSFGIQIDYGGQNNVSSNKIIGTPVPQVGSGGTLFPLNGSGIEIYHTSQNYVNDNTLTQGPNGILVWSSSLNNTIDGNSMSNFSITGLAIRFGSNFNTLTGNTLSNDNIGLFEEDSGGNTISDSKFTSNLNDFIAQNSSIPSVKLPLRATSLTYDSSAYTVSSGQNVTLKDTSITFTGQYWNDGIFVQSGSELTLQNCTVTANGTGEGYLIQVSPGAKIVIDNSVISNSGLTNWGGDWGGFQVQNGAQSIIENSIFDNISGGLDIETQGGTTFANNTILHTYIGAFFGWTGNTIVNNTFADSISNDLKIIAGNLVEGNRLYSGLSAQVSLKLPYWLLEADSSGATNFIVDNNFSNSWGGIYIASASQNFVVYHNNFANTTRNEDWGQNAWSYNGEGNYWSQYKGYDANIDGIGDTPFAIGNAQDNYPFMQPNGWLTKFYLTINTNLPASTTFQINGTSFAVGQSGSVTLPLGYVATYSFTLPQTVKLANGSTLGFSKWGDGVTTATRALKLSANSTLQAVYVLEAPTLTTTTSSGNTTATSASTFTTSSTSASTVAITASSSSSATKSLSSITTSSTNTSGSTTTSQTTSTIELAIGGAAVVLVVVGALVVRRRNSWA
ncbi:MAG: right-handed parallel beta-helix repeat-containing protein [Nitrososphaerales archaeon]